MNLDAPSIRRVLCAVDVTRPALGALRRGLQIAARFRATCDAIYARDAFPQLRLAALLPSTEELVSHLEAEERLRSLLCAQGGESASSRSIDGRPSSAILARSGLTSADLIVLGWYRREEPATRPSVAQRVASQATCAVLTAADDSTEAGIRNIVMPVDFSAATPSALSWTVAFARRFGAHVHLLHVARRRALAPLSGGAARATRALSELVASLEVAGISASSELLSSTSDPTHTILDRSGAGAFDLLIMGTHRTVPDESETGGVVAQVRRQAGLPVLSVRPYDERLAFLGHSSFGDSLTRGGSHVGTA